MRKEPVVKKTTRWVGLDVHAETIAVAVAEKDGEVRSLGIIPNTSESLRKLVKKLGCLDEVKACYEAGVTGFALYWQLDRLGVACDVIAPTLVPQKAGDRVKTDRRDAEKLARSYRSGDLTAVWVPDADHEALRDLVRAREAAKKGYDSAPATGCRNCFFGAESRPPEGMKAWTERHYKWVKSLTLEPMALEATRFDYVTEVDHVRERIVRLERAIDEAVERAPAQMRAVVEGLQALRGVAKVTAATIVAELGNLSRFESPRLLMGYSGAVPREHSSGGSISRGPITKTGNSHLRRVIIEASWAYQHKPVSTVRCSVARPT